MRPSSIYLSITALLLSICILVSLHSVNHLIRNSTETDYRARLARELQLIDLCLFTEASYTRNPATTDLHSPFQDNPGSLEHFPSGSLMSPPALQ